MTATDSPNLVDPLEQTVSVTSPRPSLPGFAGRLLVPGDRGYAEAVSGTGCRPALIARCRTLDDVTAVSRYVAHTRQRLVVIGHGDVRPERGTDGSVWCDVSAVIDTGAEANDARPLLAGHLPQMREPAGQARRHEVR